MSKNYDLIILGGGGTGLAGAMYAARLGLKVLVLGYSHGSELPVGGVITTTHLVENYPGFKSISGPDLAKKIEDHARDYEELVDIKEEKAEDVNKLKSGFSVKTPKETYHSKTVLFATGTKWKKIPESIKGSRDFENRGIAYCALCDAPLFKNKTVAVIGGSDSAAKDALVLAEHAKKVYIIYRGKEIHPEPINFERVKKNKKIEVINETNLKSINGKDFVESVTLDKPHKKSSELELQGVFVAIGHEVLSDLAKKLGVKTNKKGEIITNKEAKTNLPGVYAAGDVADTPFKQLITGVAEGCIAGHSAYEYINNERVEVA